MIHSDDSRGGEESVGGRRYGGEEGVGTGGQPGPLEARIAAGSTFVGAYRNGTYKFGDAGNETPDSTGEEDHEEEPLHGMDYIRSILSLQD